MGLRIREGDRDPGRMQTIEPNGVALGAIVLDIDPPRRSRKMTPPASCRRSAATAYWASHDEIAFIRRSQGIATKVLDPKFLHATRAPEDGANR